VFVAPVAIFALPVIYVFRFLERRQWPLTVDQAIDKLLRELSKEDLRLIRSNDANIDWFSLGQAIRNSFGLWEGNTALLDSCGVFDDPIPADAASGVILAALKQRLANNIVPNL
jgi:hypothetical protein